MSRRSCWIWATVSEYRPAFQGQRQKRGSTLQLALYPVPAPRAPLTGPIGSDASLCPQNAVNALFRPSKASFKLPIARLLARSTAQRNWQVQTKIMAKMLLTSPAHNARAPAAISPSGQIATHLNGLRATTTRAGNRSGPPEK